MLRKGGIDIKYANIREAMSASTIYSGSTDLSFLFGQGGSSINWDSGTTRTIYINENGNDSTGDGSPWNPLATLDEAFSNYKSPSGITKFIITGDIFETIDLSSYDNFIIDGGSEASRLYYNNGTTLTYKPTTTATSVSIRNLKIENTEDNSVSKAFEFGVSGASANLNNVILQNLHIKARGGSDGLMKVISNNSSAVFGSNIKLDDLTFEWGEIPTIPANSYGLYISSLGSTNHLNLTNVKLINLGASGAHSTNDYGIYVSGTTTSGRVIIDGVYGNVSPITTGNKRFISGNATSTQLWVKNADFYIDRGSDVAGSTYGIYLAKCYDCRVEIESEYNSETNLDTIVGILPLGDSTRNYAKNKLTVNSKVPPFILDEIICGMYLGAGTESYYGINEGVLSVSAQGGKTVTCDDYGIGGVYVLAVGHTYCQHVIGTTELIRDGGSGTVTFEYFDGVRTYMGGSGGITINNITATLKEGFSSLITFTHCSALGIIKGLLTSSTTIGSGVLSFINNGSSGSYTGYAAMGRGGTPTLKKANNSLVVSQFTSATSGITLSTTNMTTV